MKKLLLFAAAMFSVASINAASFKGFDGRDGSLGTQIYEQNLIQNQDNITLDETDATSHKYEIKITTGGECSFTMGDVKFWYKNSNDGTIAFKTFGTYIQPNGNKRSITIPTAAGEKVRIYTPEAFTVAAEGVAEGATVTTVPWGDAKDAYVVVTASGSQIVLWSDDRSDEYKPSKIKLGAVLPDDQTGLFNVEAGVKATKVIENGQLFIIRNGVKYNALGAVVAE